MRVICLGEYQRNTFERIEANSGLISRSKYLNPELESAKC